MNDNFRDPNAIEARFSTDLPGVVNDSDLPKEIMWAPPGIHKITASRAGKPVTLSLNIDESAAQRIADVHSKYLDAAKRGDGDRPYLDFNHDDQEASAHPTSFFWGGSDPRSGGIRAKVNWTGKGREAVRGRTYSRFSPSFYANDQTGEITGAPVNFGGLVNRAAFQRIAPIVSAKAEQEAIHGIPGVDFMMRAKLLAKARNLDDVGGIELLARERPDLYAEYRASLGLGTERERIETIAKYQQRYQQSHACSMQNDELLIRSRALADTVGCQVWEAIDRVAHEQPALYARYRAKLLGLELDPVAIQEMQARVHVSPFFVESKRIAAERGIDITAAFDIVAARSPELYDQYRANL